MLTQIYDRWKERVWKRKVSHQSKIACLVMLYLTFLAAWNQSFLGILLFLYAAATSPFWFPAALNDRNWLTRAVEGEKFWFDHADSAQQIAIFSVGSLITLLLYICLWHKRPLLSALFLIGFTLFKLAFMLFAHNIYTTYVKNYSADD